MTRIEIARKGGLALAAKVCPGYFRFIGRRGGRRSQYLMLIEIAESQERPDMRDHYIEQAEKYRDEVGTKVLMQLWGPEYKSEKFVRRRRHPIGDKELRTWERSIVK